MKTILVTFLLFLVIMAFMSLGVFFSGRRLRGSCGGTGEDCSCEGEKKADCPHEQAQSS